MSQLLIKSEKDLVDHFEEDKKKRELKHDELHEEILHYLESCHSPIMTDEEHNQYLKLCDEQDKYQNISYGEWGLFYGKIEMYYSHEGAVLENVQFCPFCGIEFIVESPQQLLREVAEN